MITLLSEQCHCAVYKMYKLLERCEKQVPYSRFVKGCWYGHNCSEHAAKPARARQWKMPKNWLAFQLLEEVISCLFLSTI